jgi:hypothetical protein
MLCDSESSAIRHVNRRRFVIKLLDEPPAIRREFDGRKALFGSQNNILPLHKKGDELWQRYKHM